MSTKIQINQVCITFLAKNICATMLQAVQKLSTNGKEAFVLWNKVKPNANVKITPPNAELVNSINDVSIALLEGLWTDKIQLIPTLNPKWCEVWLNINTKDNKDLVIHIGKSTNTDVAVIIEAEHLCMSMRGVKKPGSKTVTTVTRGAFKEDAELKREAYSMLELD